MSNLNNCTLILCYLCNSLHLSSSISFKDFLTLSNALIEIELLTFPSLVEGLPFLSVICE